jgi:hypothetical protein
MSAIKPLYIFLVPFLFVAIIIGGKFLISAFIYLLLLITGN